MLFAATLLGWLILLLALGAIGYTLLAMLAVRRFARAPLPPPATAEPVTLLKPLHGIEPRLRENLASFLDQDWKAPIQMVAGANRADDPALAVARDLSSEIVIDGDPLPLGANSKVANLCSMMRLAEHDLLILSDSDMAVPVDYVARVAATLEQPSVGAVTCIYRGRADARGWSRFAAAAISYQFAPGVVMSYALGAEQACMGSTIALRRTTLQRIGGFEAFADTLADDHAIGMAVRGLGLGVVPVPRMVLAHGCGESNFRAVWQHELRWAATVRSVNFSGHFGSLLTHPLALSLLAIPLMPAAGAAAVAVSLLVRWHLARTIDSWAGEPTAPMLWLPARDLLSFAVFVTSFAARSVDWRGAKLRIGPRGQVTAKPEIRLP
jgi:ceramide glucosyltransferase